MILFTLLMLSPFIVLAIDIVYTYVYNMYADYYNNNLDVYHNYLRRLLKEKVRSEGLRDVSVTLIKTGWTYKGNQKEFEKFRYKLATKYNHNCADFPSKWRTKLCAWGIGNYVDNYVRKHRSFQNMVFESYIKPICLTSKKEYKKAQKTLEKYVDLLDELDFKFNTI